MNAADLPPEPPSHYRDGKERLADLIVHLTGLALALVGGGMLLGLAIGFGNAGSLTAAAIYAVGLLTMLGLSTAYNFAAPRFQPLLRRFDHAGIFVMIAGSYALHDPAPDRGLGLGDDVGGVGHGHLCGDGQAVPAWAGQGVLDRHLSGPGLGDGDRHRAVHAGLGPAPLILLAIGGLLYSVGVIFYANKAMRYRRAIWHGHVVVAAAVHWVAVLLAVLK